MSRSQQAALDKIKNIGPGVCNVCGVRRADVVQVRKNWFTSINICDGCGQQVFLRYDKRARGDA